MFAFKMNHIVLLVLLTVTADCHPFSRHRRAADPAGTFTTPEGGSVLDVYPGGNMSEAMKAHIRHYEGQGFKVVVVSDGAGNRSMTATWQSPLMTVNSGSTTTTHSNTTTTNHGTTSGKGTGSVVSVSSSVSTSSTSGGTTGMNHTNVHPMMRKLPIGTWETTKDKSVVDVYPGEMDKNTAEKVKAHEAKGYKVKITGTGGHTTQFDMSAMPRDPANPPKRTGTIVRTSATSSSRTTGLTNGGSTSTTEWLVNTTSSRTDGSGHEIFQQKMPQGKWTSNAQKSVIELYPGKLDADTTAKVLAHEAKGYKVAIEGHGGVTSSTTFTFTAELKDPSKPATGSSGSVDVPQGDFKTVSGKSVIDIYPGKLPEKTAIREHEATGYEVKITGRGSQTRIAYLPNKIGA